MKSTSPFADYFDITFLINRTPRKDRLEHCEAQELKYGLDLTRFEAHEASNCIVEGQPNGNFACTASHRGVLEAICNGGYRRALVLEDDFQVVEPGMFPQDPHKDRLPFEAQWAQIVPEIPKDWDLLYLGGHYAERPLERVSKHILRTGRMLTTSSYAITAEAARKMAPHIYGVGPIDNLFWSWNFTLKSYCVDPRLFVQRPDVSDLHHQHENYVGAMLADQHGGWKLSEV
ncbi:hypothetical protein KW797_03000 [Candidatus Parcubacteria bacterium]|nr:hypothetical protein [Candidatus Parcubacteria bacterium]